MIHWVLQGAISLQIPMKRVGALNAGGLAQAAVPSSPLSGNVHQAERIDYLHGTKYQQPLSMYNEPPMSEVTLEEFEELAFSRLEVLRGIETGLIRNLKEDELVALALKTLLQSNLVLHGNEYGQKNGREVEAERRRDHLSHFILRLAFCGNPENIRWFVQHEAILLKSRFERVSSGDRQLFLASSTSDCRLASVEDRKAFTGELSAIHGSASEDFFLVPWHVVPDLVGRRGVFIRDGIAWVPKSEAFSILLTRFKEGLEAQMERTAKELPGLRDDRIVPLLELIKRSDSSQTANSDASNKGFIEGNLTADAIDTVFKSASGHFPLCMQHLQKNLRQASHLKYNGRQQYGLFLKSIGLSLEEALSFWRRSFASKVSEDKFQKEYAYNVRHNYGQEGKRANYAPYSCSKIITSPGPSVGDHHGCPFRHHGPESLRGNLSNYSAPGGGKLSKEQVDQILELVAGNHHQLACTKLFELSRKINTVLDTITYPSKFYELSIQNGQRN